MSDTLEKERKEFRSREREIEQQAYNKAKQEFEIETKKLALERQQKDIEDQRARDQEWKKKVEQDRNQQKQKLSVNENVSPMRIDPSPKKEQPKPGKGFYSIILASKVSKAVIKDDNEIEEDIYSESFERESGKSDKRDGSDLEESKMSEKPPKAKTTLGQKLISRFGNDYGDEIDDSATLDFNLTKTGSIQDSLPMFPINLANKTKKPESDKDRLDKIQRLTQGKDPFSSYVREFPDDEDYISEDSNKK